MLNSNNRGTGQAYECWRKVAGAGGVADRAQRWCAVEVQEMASVYVGC